ncbi:hypothetical protein [Flavobacterium sp. ACN6]|uniref:hypothetical protein n=1 Tax=Flavobacterium sp. ACN6 TaxID=1920426 RepID=UPI000BB38A78|nr:hypothetical protein [Flavobacterium sp. ACN6]
MRVFLCAGKTASFLQSARCPFVKQTIWLPFARNSQAGIYKGKLPQRAGLVYPEAYCNAPQGTSSRLGNNGRNEL